MNKVLLSLLCAGWLSTTALAAPDYGKCVQALDPALKSRLMGRWQNPVDRVIIEISSVELVSGEIRGKVQPVTSPAAADEHELIAWVSAAPSQKEPWDSVVPVTFTTTVYEYGTLPVWAGFLREGKLVIMHYLAWPNTPYTWDHITTFAQTWMRLP